MTYVERYEKGELAVVLLMEAQAEIERLHEGDLGEAREYGDRWRARANEVNEENGRLREILRWLLKQIDDVKRSSVIRESNIYSEACAALAVPKETTSSGVAASRDAIIPP